VVGKGSIFFEKKKQKAFGAWSTPTTGGALQLTKFFWFFLFTRRRLLLHFSLLISIVTMQDRH